MKSFTETFPLKMKLLKRLFQNKGFQLNFQTVWVNIDLIMIRSKKSFLEY